MARFHNKCILGGGCMCFAFQRNFPSVSQSGCTTLCPHQHAQEVQSLYSIFCLYSEWLVVLILAILTGMQWYLTVVITCIYLLAEQLFMCLFMLLGEMSIFLAYFIIGLLIFLFWICNLFYSMFFFIGICLLYSPPAHSSRVQIWTLGYYLKIQLN